METFSKEATPANKLIPVTLELPAARTVPAISCPPNRHSTAAVVCKEIVELSDGFTTSGAFYDRIEKQINAILPALKKHRIQKANDLCGRDFWEVMDVGDRRVAGRCISHMVVHDRLPLVFVKGRHEYPIRYRIKENA